MNLTVTEAEFEAGVIEYAELQGWLVYHTRLSKGSVPGFPDLTMARDYVLFAELKAEKGRVSPAQLHWIERLTDAGVQATVWRPSMWPQIEKTLRR